MANTGLFYLYDVVNDRCDGIGDNRNVVKEVRAECMACRTAFTTSGPPTLVNIPGGGVMLQCPNCTVHQAIASARFAEFAERFPKGRSAEPSKLRPFAMAKNSGSP